MENLYVYVIVFFLYIIMFILLYFEYRKVMFIKWNMVIVKGKIINHKLRDTGYNSLKFPIIEFLNPCTNEVDSFVSGYTSLATRKVGKEMDVVIYERDGEFHADVKKLLYMRLILIVSFILTLTLGFVLWLII